MGRPAGKWPTYALENLEDSLAKLKELEKVADSAQEAITEGDDAKAQRQLGDVRALALKCVENLVRARAGKYEQQEKAPQWKEMTDDRATKAVRQVMATRRQ